MTKTPFSLSLQQQIANAEAKIVEAERLIARQKYMIKEAQQDGMGMSERNGQNWLPMLEGNLEEARQLLQKLLDRNPST